MANVLLVLLCLVFSYFLSVVFLILLYPRSLVKLAAWLVGLDPTREGPPFFLRQKFYNPRFYNLGLYWLYRQVALNMYITTIHQCHWFVTYNIGYNTQPNFVLVNAGIVCVNLPAFKLHTFYVYKYNRLFVESKLITSISDHKKFYNSIIVVLQVAILNFLMRHR